MLALLFFLAIQPEYTHTAIYAPLMADHVTVGSKGTVFLVNSVTNDIIIYNQDGQQIRNIEQYGPDSKAFQSIESIKVMNDHLFCQDLNGLHEFTADGTWIHDLTHPAGGVLQPSLNGFLLQSSRFDAEKGQMSTVIKWLDKEFQDKSVLVEYPESHPFTRSKDGTMTIHFNPVESRPQALIDQTGAFLLLSIPNSSEITIYEIVPEFKLKTTAKLTNARPLPFNREWGETIFKTFQKSSSGIQSDLVVVRDFPDHFPLIQYLSVTPDNTIMVALWAPSPNEPTVIYLNWEGDKIQSEWSLEEQRRILHMEGDYVYLSSFDIQNRDFGCIKLPVKEAKDWIQTHPIRYGNDTFTPVESTQQ
jgi:hypothetical protein